MRIAALALWAAASAPRITKWFLPLAAMVMALPLAIKARSITLPLTISALELGKSRTMFGGRPISSAFSKSLEYLGLGSPMMILLSFLSLRFHNNLYTVMLHRACHSLESPCTLGKGQPMGYHPGYGHGTGSDHFECRTAIRRAPRIGGSEGDLGSPE